MPLDANSAKGQLVEVYSALSGYLASCSTHLQGTGSSPTQTPLLSLKTDEALALSVLTTEKGASERVGALVEAVSMSTAVLREVDLATMTRQEIYAAAASDFSADADLVSSIGTSDLGLFGGK